MTEEKLVDPIQAKVEEKQEIKAKEDMKSLSVDSLSIEDFQPLQPKAERTPHPFEGYPEEKIKINVSHTDKFGESVVNEVEVSKTHLVALHPNFYVHQDPSNKGIDIKGKDGQFRQVDFETHHNRVVVNYEKGQKNNDIVFDRRLVFKDGRELRIAIIPEPSVRAQLCFTSGREGGIRVNRDYLLLDGDQDSRLRRVYQMIYQQANQAEILAQRFDDAQESPASN